ncbi:MAG: hypothetical protein C0175_06070 [Caldisericum exile]|uniref:Uncharacterized protein n=1 Tax=Caldisericum exile TaxID=693075 RepID=A0A2J6X460_9BACT|nr:MAG: hypothetical protein C0175_06070 [Caldisericum exile]
MDKCEILKEVNEWSKDTIKKNPSILNNLKSDSKRAASLIKNTGMEKYLSLDGVYAKALRENEVESFKVIMNLVKAKIKENKYTEDDILLFLGYLSRELTFYESSKDQKESKKDYKQEETQKKEYRKNDLNSKSLTSNPFANLQDMLDKKEGK